MWKPPTSMSDSINLWRDPAKPTTTEVSVAQWKLLHDLICRFRTFCGDARRLARLPSEAYLDWFRRHN